MNESNKVYKQPNANETFPLVRPTKLEKTETKTYPLIPPKTPAPTKPTTDKPTK